MSVPTSTPSQPDVQATFCATLVDEWARAGVTEAVVCPGSRSTPLALALASDPRISVHVRLDERSAAFFAIGSALVTQRAAVICTTSGTAAAELHAGVVEAHHTGAPLLVCTADRPQRLHAVGAPQTIEQCGLFGPAVRFAATLGVARWAERDVWRSLAARAVTEASQGPLGPGPVHLNLEFDEPLLGEAATLPRGRESGAPWHRVSGRDSTVAARWSDPPGIEQLEGRRVLVVAGGGAGEPDAILGCAQALGAPVLADWLSGCRRRRNGVVAAGDAILRSDDAASLLRPDVVLRFGAVPASKVLATRLHDWALAGTDHVIVDDRWRWVDPDRDALTVIDADVRSWCESVSSWCDTAGEPPAGRRVRGAAGGTRWLALWATAESAAQDAIGDWCAAHVEATEPGIARSVMTALPRGALLVVASSMPIRDLEWFAGALADPPRVLANRGANGIDGVVSTAMGAAGAGAGPVVALVGDLAFLHDLTALVRLQGSEPAITVVVVDNGGGGIFSFLPHRGALPGRGAGGASFENLFGTPPATGVSDAARGLGATVVEVSSISDLEEALRTSVGSATTCVVRVEVPGRDENVRLHDEINGDIAKRVADALAMAGGHPG
ncbi:MAG: 2-succinyl-5-enolpyruvyl-6-hydroxy-3-cyclohexene-1-carboxylic-acid synthase [Acidimicrobiales bacterium]